MKRLLPILLALAIAPASWAAPPSPMLPIIEDSTTQALTQAAPTLSTEGMSLGHVLAFRVSVCAIGGNLTATGNLRAYLYVPTQGVWIRNPALDLAITLTGVACQAYGDLSSSIHKGRFKYVADSIGLSAGTQVTVLLEAVVQ